MYHVYMDCIIVKTINHYHYHDSHVYTVRHGEFVTYCPVHSDCVRCLHLSIRPAIEDHGVQLVQFVSCTFLELFVSCTCYGDVSCTCYGDVSCTCYGDVSCTCYGEEVDHIDHDRLSIRYCVRQVSTTQCISYGDFLARLLRHVQVVRLPGLYVTFRSYGCCLSNIACSLVGAESSGFVLNNYSLKWFVIAFNCG